MSFLSNLFGRARKALALDVAKLRDELSATEKQIRKDIVASEVRLTQALAAALNAAKAEAPVVVADVVKAAEEQPKA